MSDYAIVRLNPILHVFKYSGGVMGGPCVLCGSPFDPELMHTIRAAIDAHMASFYLSRIAVDGFRVCDPTATLVFEVMAS